MQGIEKTIIDRLFSSFSELERAIGTAKRALEEKDWIPGEVTKRVESYDTILEKQRSLAADLAVHLDNENWEEVSRHVSLINGLSALIRDDAKAILKALSGKAPPDKALIC